MTASKARVSQGFPCRQIGRRCDGTRTSSSQGLSCKGPGVMDYIQIRLGPPSKTATIARPTLSSSRVPFLALPCAAHYHAVNKTLAPCHGCQEPLGPCAGGVFGPTGMHRSTHGSRTSCHRGQNGQGALRAGRTTDHVVQLVRLVRVRASASQGVEKAKTKAGLDPKSRYDIVRRTCSRPSRRQRKRREGGPGPTGESSLRFSSTGPLLRSGDVWRSSKQSHPYQRSN